MNEISVAEMERLLREQADIFADVVGLGPAEKRVLHGLMEAAKNIGANKQLDATLKSVRGLF